MKHEQIHNARCANDTTCTHTDLIVAAIDRLTRAVLLHVDCISAPWHQDSELRVDLDTQRAIIDKALEKKP